MRTSLHWIPVLLIILMISVPVVQADPGESGMAVRRVPGSSVEEAGSTHDLLSAGSWYTRTIGSYTIVLFNRTGAVVWTPPAGVTRVDYLVVGGGGEGGTGGYSVPEYYPGGGGGGGGVLNGTGFPVSGAQTVIVGAGGSGTSGTVPSGADGGSSVFGTSAHNITVLGGGGGAGWGTAGRAGGSGGGGSGSGSPGGSGTAGQGYAGSAGNYTLPGNPAGGGGGAGAPGAGVYSSASGGQGGDGRAADITGTAVYYGSGGGGGIASADPFGAGGTGCGGDGSRGDAKAAKCQSTGAGGGGAGGGSQTHGAGGSGSVVIRYLTPKAPVAGFTGAPVKGLAPLTVRFTDLSKNTPTSWRWNFGDGNATNATAKNPVHTFHAPGTYRVTLNATNAVGSNRTTKNNFITVSPFERPLTDFTGIPLAGAAPLTVWFTDTSKNFPVSWRWNFGDGNTINATVKNPVHTFQSPGTYRITLNATNAAGSNRTAKTGYIRVSAPAGPAADFTGTPQGGAAPLTVRFTDSSENFPASWEWDFGDGDTTNATVQDPVHTYAAPGVYTVSLNVTNAAGSNTTMKSGFITVSVPGPITDFAGTPPAGAAPLTVRFTDSSENFPAFWEWDFGDGDTTNATVQDPVHTYAAPGVYTVSLNVTNAAGSNTTMKSGFITVLPPGPVANFTGMPTTGKSPLTVRFTDLSENTPVTWEWDFGDGDPTNATLQDPVHTYAAPGVYTVSLNVTSAAGSNMTMKSGFITVTTSLAPTAGFTASPQSGRGPLTVRFTDTSKNAPATWKWSFGDGNATNSTVQNPVHTYRLNGVYNVSLTATNSNGSDKKTRYWYITVSPFPQQTKIVGNYTVVIFNGTGQTTWRPPSGVTQVDYLIVGGGGEGGNAGWFSPEYYPGGGGGGGGVLHGTGFSVTGAQTVIVGAGGSGTGGSVPAGANGGKSVFGTITHNVTALGGGGGAGWGTSGSSGGSGGGGSGSGSPGGSGIASQGFAGGTGNYTLPGNPAGGGGGAAVPGLSPVSSATGGRGGDGRLIGITGTAVYYGSGGGGGIGGTADPSGAGGRGCGGDGSIGAAKPAKCPSTGAGGGGAGSGSQTHGAGGSGVVIIRYLTPA